jgi:bloom syndrome protein
MSGRDVFVLMPTGGGKSLCFQLPAIVQQGVTIVVSPLIALIQDQVMFLRDLQINADHLGANQDSDVQREIYRDLHSPSPQTQLLYVTPEKIAQSNALINVLQQVYRNGKLARLVIDEAHCISQWGHDFRPDYRALQIFKQLFPDVPVMALTATATDQVRVDVISSLRLKDCICFNQSFNRPNLRFEIRKKQQ